MNRRDVIKKIKKAAKDGGVSWELRENGKRHDLYDLDGVMIPIPRHNEITEQMAEIIWKECESKLGQGWWRK
ncbi:hypothetical protein [Flexivirga oryzae]|uniref:Type II toxin-antitoxin system HicA family toxin n=1 Tax=Flexivirga oryzae TaxID=1794944 RepID=A0A839N651_9MICO|nr:hypothetical protein [Flexivirga oryzae]MBB2890202.1 hypothetical protein [Flexivirga oryzae]